MAMSQNGKYERLKNLKTPFSLIFFIIGDRTRYFDKLTDLEFGFFLLFELVNSTWVTNEVDKIPSTFDTNGSAWTWLDYLKGTLPDHGYEIWRQAKPGKKGQNPRPPVVTFRHVG